jgi:Trypsin-co-occurring domain 1
MMHQTVPLRVSAGGQVLVEVSGDGAVVRTGPKPAQAAATAVTSMSDVLVDVRDAADDAVRTLRTMSEQPARIELAFGIKITGEATAVVAKAGAEAQFHVTVVWERDRGGAS